MNDKKNNKMNKFWSRYCGLILTNWELNDEFTDIQEKELMLSLFFCMRTGESFLFNNEVININSCLYNIVMFKK